MNEIASKQLRSVLLCTCTQLFSLSSQQLAPSIAGHTPQTAYVNHNTAAFHTYQLSLAIPPGQLNRVAARLHDWG